MGFGLFDKIFKKPRENIDPDGFYEVLNGYSPVFTNAPESVYEMGVIRAAIHSFATFCSKLKPEMTGSAYKYLANTLQYKPNPYMDTSKFLYRIATILSVNNTAFIAPIPDEGGFITGYFPLLPQSCEVVNVRNEPWLRYTFSNGKRAYIEFERVGILTQHQYDDDFFGGNNGALKPTMQLIHTQNQGIINGVKNSASIRFLARIGNVIKPEDIAAERQRFTDENLSSENKSGMIIYDNKFADLKQIDSKPYTATALQMQQINNNVFQYYGTNEAILQNKYNENEWSAYYEGKIEPFALQLSLVMSNMTFTPREIAHGNSIYFSANRLQYASTQTKLNISTSFFDRGLLNRNGAMDIWGLPHVDGGDKFYIRKDYAELGDLGKENDKNADSAGSSIQNDGNSADASHDSAGGEEV